MIFFLNKENDFMSLMDFVKLFVNFLLNYLVLHDLHASYHLFAAIFLLLIPICFRFNVRTRRGWIIDKRSFCCGQRALSAMRRAEGRSSH